MAVSLDRDLNDVLVFVQVVSAGSFTAAGKELGILTSTVSRRVSRLEEALGVKLLQRTTRALSLTDAGRLYYERCTAVFVGLEDAEDRLADAQAAPKGRVRITAPLEHAVSMQLVGPFMERYPDVRVDLELTNRGVNILEEGYDAAITAGPLTHQSVVAHKLLDSPFRLVAAPAYLADHPAPRRASEISEHDCVIFGHASTGATWTFHDNDQEIAVQVRGRLAVNHLGAVRDAAMAGLGIARLPDLVCRGDVQRGNLRELLPELQLDHVPVWITHAPGRFLPPAVRAFVDHTKEHFARLADEYSGVASMSSQE